MAAEVDMAAEAAMAAEVEVAMAEEIVLEVVGAVVWVQASQTSISQSRSW